MSTISILAQLRQAVSPLPGFRGMKLDPLRSKVITVVVSRDEETEGMRAAAARVLQPHGFRLQVRLLADVAHLAGYNEFRAKSLLPYECHGFVMRDRDDRTSKPTVFLPATVAECRDLTSTLSGLHADALHHDVIVAVATGGISILHYLIGRWSRHELEKKWPSTEEEMRAAQKRFQLICGFRSGWGKGAFKHGVNALAEVLEVAQSKSVMIVDTTFKGTGVQTLLKVISQAAPGAMLKKMSIAAVVDSSRLGAATLPNFSIPPASFPLTLRLYPTQRILMEDVASAIGFEQVASSREIVPTNAGGRLLIRGEAGRGFFFQVGTLSDFMCRLVDDPHRRFGGRGRPLGQIEHEVRSFLKSVDGVDWSKGAVDIVKAFIAGEIDVCELGRRVRTQGKGVLLSQPHSGTVYSLVQKMQDETERQLKAEGVIEGNPRRGLKG